MSGIDAIGGVQPFLSGCLVTLIKLDGGMSEIIDRLVIDIAEGADAFLGGFRLPLLELADDHFEFHELLGALVGFVLDEGFKLFLGGSEEHFGSIGVAGAHFACGLDKLDLSEVELWMETSGIQLSGLFERGAGVIEKPHLGVDRSLQVVHHKKVGHNGFCFR